MDKPRYQSLEWIDILRYLFSNLIPIASIVAIASVITVIFALMMDNEYKATANLLPNQSRSIGFDLFSKEGGLQSLASSVLGGESEENNRFYVLLRSYTTKKKVVEKFDLIEVYELQESQTPMLDAMNLLAENTNFEGLEEGNFVISVWDKDPQRAKQITDFYVELLNEFNTEIATREAREFRAFIGNRYQQAVSDLDSLRGEMAAFQAEHGVFELPEQVKQYFALISGLTAKRYEASMKLDMLGKTVQRNSESYRQTKDQLEVIETNLERIYSDQDKRNMVLNFDRLPELGSRYFDLMMAIEIQTEIQKFVVPLYEQAKMEEAKSLPVVTIVDQPVVPAKKDRPRRSIIAVLGFLSAGILAVLYFIARLHWLTNRDYYRYIVKG